MTSRRTRESVRDLPWADLVGPEAAPVWENIEARVVEQIGIQIVGAFQKQARGIITARVDSDGERVVEGAARMVSVAIQLRYDILSNRPTKATVSAALRPVSDTAKHLQRALAEFETIPAFFGDALGVEDFDSFLRDLNALAGSRERWKKRQYRQKYFERLMIEGLADLWQHSTGERPKRSYDAYRGCTSGPFWELKSQVFELLELKPATKIFREVIEDMAPGRAPAQNKPKA